MLERGFWLYVWRVASPEGDVLYVGRTGDNSPPYASAPYTRMGQHLGRAKHQNALHQHLSKRGIDPLTCSSFDLSTHGPVYPEVKNDGTDRAERFKKHLPFRNNVAVMEKLLCDGLREAGYLVMNIVRCRFELSVPGVDKWQVAKSAFRQEFPDL